MAVPSFGFFDDCLLWILCHEQSGFEGYIRDKYTALPETRERLLATEVTASWRYDVFECNQT
jgi:urate oxidase